MLLFRVLLIALIAVLVVPILENWRSFLISYLTFLELKGGDTRSSLCVRYFRFLYYFPVI